MSSLSVVPCRKTTFHIVVRVVISTRVICCTGLYSLPDNTGSIGESSHFHTIVISTKINTAIKEIKRAVFFHNVESVFWVTNRYSHSLLLFSLYKDKKESPKQELQFREINAAS